MRQRMVVVLVALAAGAAHASCGRLVCWCGQAPAEMVLTQSIDGDGGVTVQRSDGGVGHYARLDGETAGSSSLVLDSTRSLIDADGKVSCDALAQKVLAATVQSAVNSGACEEVLLDAGVAQPVQPPCNDVRGCSIGVTPLIAVLLGPLLFGFARRRRASVESVCPTTRFMTRPPRRHRSTR